MRSEVEYALQSTTEMLSQVTRLLALVSAPALETAIGAPCRGAAAPAVGRDGRRRSPPPAASRRSCSPSTEPVDPGLAAWASEYLNERLAGVRIGTHTLRRRIDDPGLTGRRAGVPRRAAAGLRRPGRADGAVALRRRGRLALDDVRADELEACRRLLSVLEKRAACSS